VRLLVLAPFAPRTDARHGGARAIAATVVALSARHEVGLVHLSDGGQVDDAVRDAAAFVEELPAADVRGYRRLAYRLRVYASLGLGTPVAVAERAAPRTVQRLYAIAEQWRPELVQAEFLTTAALLPALDRLGIPAVLVDHDATLRPVESFEHLPRPLAARLRRRDERAWRTLAKRLATRVRTAVAFTERDRAACEEAGFEDVRIVPLVVPRRGPALDPLGTPPPTVLFAGYYRHPPNADAARWLVEEIFPRVVAARPDARLVLVGDELPADVAARAGESVDVLGPVDDLEPLLDAAAVVVAPLRLGGGTRVKVIEALAAGKAVVATPRALEGLDAPAGEAVLVASSAHEQAAQDVALLGDDERRRRLGEAARAWATEALDGRRTAERFDAIYADVLGRR
jgi:glycosyltransferase involved in cell wall biosynthesis